MRKIIWIIKYRVIVVVSLVVIVASILVKGYFSTSLSEYVKYDCTNKVNNIILKSINENVVANLPSDSLMNVTYNDNKEVVYAYINTQKTSEILTNTGIEISNLTKEFNDNGRSKLDIPIGYLISESVFLGNNITIPVNISNITSYNIKLETNVKEYGINSSLVTVNLKFDFAFKTIIPLITNDVTIEHSVPLLSTVLYGDVPNYFFEGITPNISVS